MVPHNFNNVQIVFRTVAQLGGGGAPEFTPPHLSILRPSPCHDAFNYELSSNPFLLNCFFGFKIDLFDIAG